jgi:hypothetical protein
MDRKASDKSLEAELIGVRLALELARPGASPSVLASLRAAARLARQRDERMRRSS